jgi:hypothetical protein
MRWLGSAVFVVLVACGSSTEESASSEDVAAGGGGSTAISPDAGKTQTGASAGHAATGGSKGTGGAVGTGGSASTGGATTTGGAAGSGGIPRADGGSCGYVPPAGTGVTGTWTKIAMPVPFTYAMSLLSDPVRPSDFYAFLTGGGGTPVNVVKSTDYGATWSVISAGAMSGDPWGAAIDPDPNRDPCTPPTMYTPAGYGSLGLFKSTDGGANWQQLLHNGGPFATVSANNDLYSVAILPDDPPNHLLVTFHGYFAGSSDAGLGESFDGGATWLVHAPPTGMGQSQYLLLVDENTWITVAQWASNTQGTWRTTTAGRVGGTISTAAWQQVDKVEHTHGAYQGFVDSAHSAVYNAGTRGGGDYGIYRSTDSGATWSSVYRGDSGDIVATGTYLYSSYLLNPNPVRTARTDGVHWAAYTTTPTAMVGQLGPGTQTVASSSDGTHWYIINNVNDGGVWRYVE